MWQTDIPIKAKPIGYRFLVENFDIKALPHHCWSYVTTSWDMKEFQYEDLYLEVKLYSKSYQIDNEPIKHIEFALKHEGVNFTILKRTFSFIGPQKVTEHILSSPTGKYSRKIWFLYEFLLEENLPIDNIKRGNYVELLDPKEYYCGHPEKSPRHRIINNLLGNKQFSPIVRRTKKITQLEKKNLSEVTKNLTEQYDPHVLARATRYLYTKETMASWEIERERPDHARLARFVSLLQRDFTKSELSKRFLFSLQKEIVDSRFCLEDYRTFQNYVGEEPRFGELLVHFIAPKPEDLPSLMEGLTQSATKMFQSELDPVIVSTILSFGFVFFHPFWDGNGRLHRFLIHYTLSKLSFTPDQIVFPVSATMLHNMKDYDRTLETLSRPLMEQIHDYTINEKGEMTVHQETADYYRYVDFTPMAEFLYTCVENTIHVELENELKFLCNYDSIKSSLQEIVDMPDQQIDLFIKCIRQNNGTLSKRKRESLFRMLSEKEIEQMEKIVQQEGL